MKLKKHVCTADCSSAGHMYAHGEEGHTCGKACAAMMHKDKEPVAHVCSDKCTSAGHHYAHGEKGHSCGKECKAMMKKKDSHGHDHDHDHDH